MAMAADPSLGHNDLSSEHSGRAAMVTLTFDDVALYFTKQEWELLNKWQKQMYQEVMKTNYETLDSLGCVFSKPDLITWMEQGIMLLIRDQECLSKTRMTLGPSADEQLDLKNTGKPPCLGDQGPPGAKEKECHLNSFQKQGLCAPSLGEEKKLSSDQRATSQHLHELEILHKNHITASDQDKNDPWHEVMSPQGHREVPLGPSYSCCVCRKVFHVKTDLIKHRQNHSKSQPSEYLKYKSKFGRHSDRKWTRTALCKKNRFQSGECDKNYYVKCSLIAHQAVHTAQQPFQCLEGDETCRSKATLKKHQCLHKGEGPFSCQECGKAFIQQSQLTEHMRVHTGEKASQCPECGQSFRLQRNLKAHLAQHSGENPFPCPERGKAYAQQSQLTEHMRIHSGEKPLRCPESDNSLHLKGNLKSYLLQHTGQTPFSCVKCGKRFTQQYRLAEHIRAHCEKFFQCPECDKRYCIRGSLKVHLYTHSGQKPFKCKECGKGLLHKRSLQTHLHRHREERPFSCNECGRSFTYMGALTTHIAAMHAREKPTSL